MGIGDLRRIGGAWNCDCQVRSAKGWKTNADRKLNQSKAGAPPAMIAGVAAHWGN